MEMISRTEQLVQLREWITTGQARRLREAAGVSQTVAAVDCEVTPGAILRWETGTRTPQGRNIAAYHRFLTGLAGRVVQS